MALTIKTSIGGNININTKNSNIMLKKIVNDCIKSALLSKLKLRSPGMIKWIQYFPAYKLCSHTKEKTLSSIFLKVKYQRSYVSFSVDEMEITGASCIEFIDYLEEKGANELIDASEILETI